MKGKPCLEWLKASLPVLLLFLIVGSVVSLPSKTNFYRPILLILWNIRYSSYWSLDSIHLLVPVWLIRFLGIRVETGLEFLFSSRYSALYF